MDHQTLQGGMAIICVQGQAGRHTAGPEHKVCSQTMLPCHARPRHNPLVSGWLVAMLQICTSHSDEIPRSTPSLLPSRGAQGQRVPLLPKPSPSKHSLADICTRGTLAAHQTAPSAPDHGNSCLYKAEQSSWEADLSVQPACCEHSNVESGRAASPEEVSTSTQRTPLCSG